MATEQQGTANRVSGFAPTSAWYAHTRPRAQIIRFPIQHPPSSVPCAQRPQMCPNRRITFMFSCFSAPSSDCHVRGGICSDGSQVGASAARPPRLDVYPNVPLPMTPAAGLPSARLAPKNEILRYLTTVFCLSELPSSTILQTVLCDAHVELTHAVYSPLRSGQ